MALLVTVLAPADVMALKPPDFSRKDKISGNARIIDGDTIEISGRRIVFFAIDAPEFDQVCRIFSLDWPCGVRARIWLERFIGGRPVKCLPVADVAMDDRDADLKAMCYSQGNLNLNAAMIGEGMAVPNLNDGDWFESGGFDARVNRRGIWAGDFIKPPLWRRGERLPTLEKRNRRQLKP